MDITSYAGQEGLPRKRDIRVEYVIVYISSYNLQGFFLQWGTILKCIRGILISYCLQSSLSRFLCRGGQTPNPRGGNNLGARDFYPPPLRDSQGGGNIALGGGAKFLNRHFNSLYLVRFLLLFTHVFHLNGILYLGQPP